MLVTLAAVAALSLAPLQTSQGEVGATDLPYAQQRAEGCWASVPGADPARLETTSVLVLHLLGEGQTAHVGPQRQRVRAALDWLRGTQRKDGSFTIDDVPASPAVQAMACLALCEAQHLSGVSDVHATRAAKRLLATLHPQGGWRASGDADAALDTRASAWGAYALLSAKEVGLIELEDELERIARALTEHNAQPVMSTKRALTHELVARVLAGEFPGSENDVLRRAELALAAPNAWRADGEGVDPELRHLQSFLAYQLGGDTWKRWQGVLKAQRELVEGEPAAGAYVHDPRLTSGGRLAAFGWNLLTLSVEYRYARIVGGR